jgi:hypothetical protein
MSRETGWYKIKGHDHEEWQFAHYTNCNRWMLTGCGKTFSNEQIERDFKISPTPVNPVPADGEPSAKDFIDFLHYALIDDCETLRHVDGLFSVFIETRVVKDGE